MARFGFVPVDDDPFADSRSTAPALEYAKELRNPSALETLSGVVARKASDIGSGLTKDANDLMSGIIEPFATLGNALMGDMELEIGSDGAVSPMDPRLVDAGAALSGMVGGPGSLMPRPSGSIGVFGGINAKTADTKKLYEATILERQGYAPESIWQSTGWARGADGEWRFEISDAASRYNENALKPWAPENASEAREIRKAFNYADASSRERAEIDRIVERNLGAATTLEDALDHPALYEAYPDLRNMRIERTEREDFGGYYDPQNNFIAATPRGADVKHLRGNEGHSVTLHEVQHAIQSREGFAHGGSPADPLVAEGGQKMIEQLVQRRNQIKREISLSPITDERLVTEYAQITRALGRMGNMPLGDVGYQTLAGEVEARNVESRFSTDKSLKEVATPAEITQYWKEEGGRPMPSATEDVPRYSQWIRRPAEWLRSIE